MARSGLSQGLAVKALTLTLLLGGGPGLGTTIGYEVRFDAAWSRDTHPLDFPSTAHFSPLVGGTHTAGVTCWENGGIASAGIEVMAETGSTGPLRGEVVAAIASGDAFSSISGGGIGRSPGSASAAFQMQASHPLVTLVSMIAPSPDWFVGVSGLALYENQVWRDEVAVPLVAYDSGTDRGATYRAGDADITPHVPISQLQDYAFADGTPLGTFTFSLIPPPPGDLNHDGSANNLDISSFIQALSSNGLATALPEPATLGLLTLGLWTGLRRGNSKRTSSICSIN